MTVPFGGRLTAGDIRQAAWVARCVGRGEAAPLGEREIKALGGYLSRLQLKAGEKLFEKGDRFAGVWIIQSGVIELVVGPSGHRVVVQLLQSGDVEGDVFIVVDQLPPYSARAAKDSDLLFISRDGFEKLLDEHPKIALRWVSSCATRVARSQARILELLGLSLAEKVARTLLYEAVDVDILVPQRTLAAMLGIARPSLNHVLKDFESRGLIRLGYAQITIVDRRGLQDVGGLS